MAIHLCSSCTERWRQENPKYIYVSPRPAWTTGYDPVSEKQIEKKSQQVLKRKEILKRAPCRKCEEFQQSVHVTMVITYPFQAYGLVDKRI